MAKSKEHWCKYTGHVEGIRRYRNGEPVKGPEAFRRPAHVRCPICRRRLIPQTVNVEPMDSIPCLQFRIPRHKIPKTKRI